MKPITTLWRQIFGRENKNDETICQYGYETCNQDDFETMCDGCLADRSESWEDARMDTYD